MTLKELELLLDNNLKSLYNFVVSVGPLGWLVVAVVLLYIGISLFDNGYELLGFLLIIIGLGFLLATILFYVV